jgi:hypothetical protein
MRCADCKRKKWLQEFLDVSSDAVAVGVVPSRLHSVAAASIFWVRRNPTSSQVGRAARFCAPLSVCHRAHFVDLQIGFLLLGAFVTMNLFVGVVIDNYVKLKHVFDGTLLMDETEVSWIELVLHTIKVAPHIRKSSRLELLDKSGHRVLDKLTKVVKADAFGNVVGVCVVLNLLVGLSHHYDQSAEWGAFQSVAEYCFASIFSLEAILKIAGLRPWRYFRDPLCLIDFVTVVLTLIAVYAQHRPISALLISSAPLGLQVAQCSQSLLWGFAGPRIKWSKASSRFSGFCACSRSSATRSSRGPAMCGSRSRC